MPPFSTKWPPISSQAVSLGLLGVSAPTAAVSASWIDSQGCRGHRSLDDRPRATPESCHLWCSLLVQVANDTHKGAFWICQPSLPPSQPRRSTHKGVTGTVCKTCAADTSKGTLRRRRPFSTEWAPDWSRVVSLGLLCLSAHTAARTASWTCTQGRRGLFLARIRDESHRDGLDASRPFSTKKEPSLSENGVSGPLGSPSLHYRPLRLQVPMTNTKRSFVSAGMSIGNSVSPSESHPFDLAEPCGTLLLNIDVPTVCDLPCRRWGPSAKMPQSTSPSPPTLPFSFAEKDIAAKSHPFDLASAT